MVAGRFYMLLMSSVNFFFLKNYPFQKYFRSTIRMSNGLDPDQGRPGSGPNCWQSLSADDTEKALLARTISVVK